MVGLRIAEPIVETLRVDLCMYAEDRRTLTHKLLDPRLLAFKRPHTQSTRTARIDEYETSIYTFRCTSLDSIAGRSNEHIAKLITFTLCTRFFPSCLASTALFEFLV